MIAPETLAAEPIKAEEPAAPVEPVEPVKETFVMFTRPSTSLDLHLSFRTNSETTEPPTVAAVEAAPATEAATTDTAKEEHKSKDKPTSPATKVGRRLSARVGGFFKAKPVKEDGSPATTPKVDEAPPKIEEPTPVAPLEEPKPAAEVEATPKPIEPAHEAAPQVSATA